MKNKHLILCNMEKPSNSQISKAGEVFRNPKATEWDVIMLLTL